VNHKIKVITHGNNLAEEIIFLNHCLINKIESYCEDDEKLVSEFIEEIHTKSKNKKFFSHKGYMFEKYQNTISRNNYTVLLIGGGIGYINSFIVLQDDVQIEFIQIKNAEIDKWRHIIVDSISHTISKADIREQLAELCYNGMKYYSRIHGRYGDRFV